MSIYDTTGKATGTASKKIVKVVFTGKKPTSAAKKSTTSVTNPEVNLTNISSALSTAAKTPTVKTTSTAAKVYPKGTTAAGKLPASAGDKSMPAGYGSMTEFYKQGLAKNAAWAQPYEGLVSGEWAKMTPSQAYLAQALAQPFHTESVSITNKALQLYPDLVNQAKAYGIQVNVVSSVKQAGIAGKDYYDTSKPYANDKQEALDIQNQTNLNTAKANWKNIQSLGTVNPGVDYMLGKGYKAVWNEQTQSHDIVSTVAYNQTPVTNERPHGSPTPAQQAKAKRESAGQTESAQPAAGMSAVDAALRIFGSQKKRGRTRFGG